MRARRGVFIGSEFESKTSNTYGHVLHPARLRPHEADSRPRAPGPSDAPGRHRGSGCRTQGRAGPVYGNRCSGTVTNRRTDGQTWRPSGRGDPARRSRDAEGRSVDQRTCGSSLQGYSVAVGSRSRYRGIAEEQPRTHGTASGRRLARNRSACGSIINRSAPAAVAGSGGGCDPWVRVRRSGGFVHTAHRELTLAGWLGYETPPCAGSCRPRLRPLSVRCATQAAHPRPRTRRVLTPSARHRSPALMPCGRGAVEWRPYPAG